MSKRIKHRPTSAQLTNGNYSHEAKALLPEQQAALNEAVSVSSGHAPAADSNPTIHLIGLHHTIPSERFNHCAFTGKQIRFPEIAKRIGYPLVEYANGNNWTEHDGSAPGGHWSHERVRIFDESHLACSFGDSDAVATNFNDADHRQYWETRVSRELTKRVKPGDIVLHVMPPHDHGLISKLPDQIHVELGIGYEADCKGTYRIFESETWRAWHQGRWGHSEGADFPHYRRFTCSAVCPNYYDASEWSATQRPDAKTPYVLFVGRMASCKGIEIVNALALRFPALNFVVISGEPRSDRLSAANILWQGRVDERASLAAYYAGALCTLVPSRYQEPFGGVCVETLLSGCPVIASDWGALTSHVGPGDGILASTVDEFAIALQRIVDDRYTTREGRELRAHRAAVRWGYDAVAPQYAAAFGAFRRLFEQGVRP